MKRVDIDLVAPQADVGLSFGVESSIKRETEDRLKYVELDSIMQHECYFNLRVLNAMKDLSSATKAGLHVTEEELSQLSYEFREMERTLESIVKGEQTELEFTGPSEEEYTIRQAWRLLFYLLHKNSLGVPHYGEAFNKLVGKALIYRATGTLLEPTTKYEKLWHKAYLVERGYLKDLLLDTDTDTTLFLSTVNRVREHLGLSIMSNIESYVEMLKL